MSILIVAITSHYIDDLHEDLLDFQHIPYQHTGKNLIYSQSRNEIFLEQLKIAPPIEEGKA